MSIRASVRSRSLRSSVRSRLLRSSVSFRLLQAKIRANALAVASRVGRFIFYQAPEDRFTVDTETTYSLARQLQDAVSAATDVSYALNKSLAEAPDLTDDSYWHLARHLEDVATSTSEAAISLSRLADSQSEAFDESSATVGKNPIESLKSSDEDFRDIRKVINEFCSSCDDLVGQFSALDSDVQHFEKVVRNAAGADEQHHFDFLASRADSMGVGELASARLERPTEDESDLSDVYFLEVEKAVADASQVLDEAIFVVAKALSDTAFVSERQVASIEKPQDDTFEAADLFQRVINFARSFDEFSEASDADKFALLKPVLDDEVVRDTPVVDLFKSFLDIASANNDKLSYELSRLVVSRATVQSTHEVQLGKPFENRFEINETPVVELAKTLLDRAGLLDEVDSKRFAKALGDYCATCDGVDNFLGALDSDVQYITKVLNDQVRVTSAHRVATSLLRASSVATDDVFDSYLFFPQEAGSDFGISDYSIQSLTKGLLESLPLSDSETWFFTKTILENPSGIDLPAKELTRSLEPQAVIESDAATVTSGKALTNTGSAADSGDLVSQGYCDLSYFAEDYVGVRYSF